MKKYIGCQIEEELKDALFAIAERKQMPVANILRRIVREYIEREG